MGMMQDVEEFAVKGNVSDVAPEVRAVRPKMCSLSMPVTCSWGGRNC